jgi:hypothetical protein
MKRLFSLIALRVSALQTRLTSSLQTFIPLFLAVHLSSGGTVCAQPFPMDFKSIFTPVENRIQLTRAEITFDWDSTFVTAVCRYTLKNHGEAAVIPVGIPPHAFTYDFKNGRKYGFYHESDTDYFIVKVDGRQLSRQQIKIPHRLDSLNTLFENGRNRFRAVNKANDSLNAFYEPSYDQIRGYYAVKQGDLATFIRQIDSLSALWKASYDTFVPAAEKMNALLGTVRWKENPGPLPWFYWDIAFKPDQKRVVEVRYRVPANTAKLEYHPRWGESWFGKTEYAKVVVHLRHRDHDDLDEVKPPDYLIDFKKNTLTWEFTGFEPSWNEWIKVW